MSAVIPQRFFKGDIQEPLFNVGLFNVFVFG